MDVQGYTCIDGWMDGCMDGWMDGWMDGCTQIDNPCIDGRTDE